MGYLQILAGCTATLLLAGCGVSDGTAQPGDPGGDREGGSDSRAYDPAYSEFTGSQGLVFRRSPSSKLARHLLEHNQQYRDLPSFTVRLDGRIHPVFNIRARFGVEPGAGDQQAKIQHALDTVDAAFAIAEGLGGAELSAPVIYFPAVGADTVYQYSDELILGNPGVILCGARVTLEALSEQNTNLFVQADDVHILGFHLHGPASTISGWVERFAADPSQTASKVGPDEPSLRGSANRIRTAHTRGLVVADNYMLGGRGGLRLYYARDVLIYDNYIERTQSDGIHVVHESQNVIVANNRLIDTGDDCISVVLYNKNEERAPVRNVLVEGNDAWGSRTRGLSVIGGEGVTQRGNHVTDSSITGILVFPSAQHCSSDASSVLVSQNLVERPYRAGNTLPYGGGIGVMGSDTTSVHDCVFYKNIVIDTQGAAFGHVRIKRSGDNVRDVIFDHNVLSGSKPDFAGRADGDGLSYLDNVYLETSTPVVDRDAYGSTLPPLATRWPQAAAAKPINQ